MNCFTYVFVVNNIGVTFSLCSVGSLLWKCLLGRDVCGNKREVVEGH